MSDEFTVDAAASAVVDAAMRYVDIAYTHEHKKQIRGELGDKVEALIDACRAYYRPEKEKAGSSLPPLKKGGMDEQRR
jgi:hypothetical protein